MIRAEIAKALVKDYDENRPLSEWFMLTQKIQETAMIGGYSFQVSSLMGVNQNKLKELGYRIIRPSYNDSYEISWAC